jgi:hypothetical protein
MKKTLLVAITFAMLVSLGVALYRRMQPESEEFAWLAFGPKENVRVLVSIAGDTITLQPFSGDKPNGKREQFKDRGQPLNISLADPDGVNVYVITRCATTSTIAPTEGPKELFVNVDINGPVKYRQYADVPEMAPSIGAASTAHFHGPLSIGPVTVNWNVPSGMKLRRGEKGTDLRSMIGTMDAERGCWVVVKTMEGKDCLFPEVIRPVVDIEFPPKSPGDPPVTRRYSLDQFC